jgi:glycosyltransferase involved in cell wall biosynthesis
VVAVGRLEHQKGHRHLIDAVARLSDRPRLVVLIVGRDGHMSAELKHQVRSLGLNGRVSFLGHRDDVPDLLAAADLLALPSLNEGAAGAAIEAMALGLPVVASDLPPLREVTEHGASGLLVPVASPQALAEAIVRLLQDHDLARALGTRGREIFEQRFTLERSVERMVGMYRAVVAAGPADRPAVPGRT